MEMSAAVSSEMLSHVHQITLHIEEDAKRLIILL
jgi:hypothetical protein